MIQSKQSKNNNFGASKKLVPWAAAPQARPQGHPGLIRALHDIDIASKRPHSFHNMTNYDFPHETNIYQRLFYNIIVSYNN
jgi:hypothetical protein